MTDFNLEYYRAFYTVAQTGSATKAAAALYLSQPAITHSIRMLEENLGAKLFLRTAKGMRLTHEGQVLHRYVEGAFNELSRGEKELKSLIDLESGQVSIVATETPLYYYLLPKLKVFREMHPNIIFNVTGSFTDENLRMLRAREVDIAMIVSPLQDVDDLNAIVLNDFHDIFIAGPDFAHLKDRVVPLEELMAQPVVAVEKGTSARKNMDSWFAGRGIDFTPRYSVRTSTIVLPFVEQNLAVGIIPTMFAQDLIDSGRVFQVQTREAIPPRQIVIMYHKASISVTSRRFIEFLSQEPASGA